MSADIFVIIVTYNSANTIKPCLMALQGQSLGGFSVILVDNASGDGTIEEVESLIPQLSFPIKTISLDYNTGFTGGNIEGLRHANGKYVALLNPDTVPDSGWLEALVREMDAHPEVGICASLLIDHDSGLVDSAGDGFSSALKGYKRGEGQPPESFAIQGPVFGACAGAALYRCEMLDEVGFLDEEFFLIHEDTDLNVRAQLAGWRVLYVPSAKVLHKVRSSIGFMSPNAVYYSIRNSKLVMVKSVPFGIWGMCLPVVAVGLVMEFAFFVLRHGMPGAYFRANLDFLRLMPSMLKKRKSIMGSRSVPVSSIYNMMTSAFKPDYFWAKLKKLISGR